MAESRQDWRNDETGSCPTAGLAIHDHAALFYYDQRELLAAAVDYLRLGLERGEKCLYVADDTNRYIIAGALQAEGIDVDAEEFSGALTITTREETYTAGGCFRPENVLGSIIEISQRARKEGFAGFRGAGEMTWALEEFPGSRKLLHYEAQLNALYPGIKAMGFCQYNLWRFPAEVIEEIIRVHPRIVYRGLLCRNPYYILPEGDRSGKIPRKVGAGRLLEMIYEYETLKRGWV